MPTPNFEYDLFISYAHIDNQHYSEVPQGWVDYLHERLQVSLSRRLGRAPRIWRDRKLRGNDVFDDEIKQTLANTAIFLPVMSPRYLESTSCRAEVQDSSRLVKQQGGVRIGSKHRVFKVVITDVPLAAHPEEWQGLWGYAFYEKDPASGRVREFDHLLIGEERDKRYWDRFEDLASDINETLDFLRDDAERRPQSAQDRRRDHPAAPGEPPAQRRRRQPDQLPILQHALMRTWGRWKRDAQGDDPIDLRHYEAIGGLSEALPLPWCLPRMGRRWPREPGTAR